MAVEYPGKWWRDYELLDCGDGRKLERFGRWRLARPEPKALWPRSENDWGPQTDSQFCPGAGFGRAGKEDSGTWRNSPDMPEQWQIGYHGAQEGLDLNLRLGLTAFKHVGVFPEQAPNWEYIYSRASALARAAREAGRPAPKVLNLFAYTGAASMAARAAGAEVTHLDSVRQVVTWARGNMERSGLDGIRWVVEDAMKFTAREVRRGNRYQGIILDPPAYGHGPDGEKWKLDECLYSMMQGVAQLLDPTGSFMVLNLYSNGFSALLGETVVREAFGLGGADAVEGKGSAGGSRYRLESGELALRDRHGKVLPLSIFVRLER